MRGRGRAALVAALVALVALVATSCGGPSTVRSALSVRGNLLVDQAGRRFVVKGVTVEVVPFYAASDEAATLLTGATDAEFANREEVFRSIRAAGANTVRIPVSADVYRSLSAKAAADYLNRLSASVAAATANGLTVIIGWWDSLAAGSALPDQVGGWLPAMKAVADLFRRDPSVLYEPMNEPNDVEWTTWRSVTARVVSYWRKVIGYRGPLVLDTSGYSWNFDPASADAIIALDKGLLGRADVVFANHRYANQNTCFCGPEKQAFVDTIEGVVGKYAILGTEYGAFNGANPPHLEWNAEFLDYLATTSIPAGLNGAVAFVWHWIDPNTIAQPGTATLTPWGQIVEQELLARRLP